MADKTPLILVPLGFSEQSILALQQAVIYGKAMGARLQLLTVMEDNNQFLQKFDAKDDKKDEIREKVKAEMERYAEEYRQKSGLEIETKVTSGTVYEEVARVAELDEADLVIVGTNGKPTNFRKRFIGSNAYRIVMSVEPPVITVKGVRKVDEVKTIIFPLTLDRRSKEKTGVALHYARLFGAKIKIVAILTAKDEEKRLRANVNQVQKFITEAGVDCTADLIEPEKKGVVRNTLQFSKKHKGDLIIITEDNRERDITDYFMGTEVQAVIYHSEIPVMCFTPSEMKYEAMWSGGPMS